MSAYLGVVLPDRCFLAADSRRTDLTQDRPWPAPIRKIEPLKETAVIATGGVGTWGHVAREQIRDRAARHPEMPLEHLLEFAKQALQREHQRSLAEHPGHSVPLYCIIAGRDQEQAGFLYVMRSDDGFREIRFGAGTTFTSGSNTKRLTSLANEAWPTAISDGHVRLDRWALATIGAAAAGDPHVALPAQLVMAGPRIVDRFPVLHPVSLEGETTFRLPIESGS